METLIQRLVANPHDEEALAYAHRAGTLDPRSYAVLLEKVGAVTPDPVYAAHWLTEAANVWSTTIGDAHHAARLLMDAINKDPTQRTAAERLAQLYREKGDQKALVALLERLVKALSPLVNERPEVRPQLAAMHEELGRLWGDAFGRPERAIENWRRLVELDPTHAYAIYAVRELLKSQQQYAEALPYFAMEHALIEDPERHVALLRDEADVRRRLGDLPGATQTLRNARAYRPDDPTLTQELGLSILERLGAGEGVSAPEREESAQLFISLAELYDGEYGLSYSVSALKAVPGNDRAMQLADYYANALNRAGELAPRYAAYLQANPNGFMANEARAKAGSARPPAALPSMPAMSMESPPQMAGYGYSPPAHDAGPSANARSNAAPAVAAAASSSVSAFRSQPAPASPAEMPAQAPHAGNLQQLLAEAQTEGQKGRKPQALAKFREILKIEPANAEALAWVEEHLRQRRMYADLRDVLLAASRVPTVHPETRKAQLRDVAGLCESQLRDLESAIQAWKQICQIDRADDQAREQLRRLLERGARWDDLASILEQEAMSAPEVEQKIGLEKKLATLHEQKRKDPASAAEAWARIASLVPEDDTAVQTAVKLYEKAERFDLGAQVITDSLSSITEKVVRGALLQRLGELRMKINDPGGAGEAFAEAAETSGLGKLWELAEKAYLAANRHTDAASAIEQRAQLLEGKQQAALFAQAADLYLKGDDASSAIARLERSAEIDPANDTYAQALEGLFRREERFADLISYLLGRASKLNDKGKRIAARRLAAELQAAHGDPDGARESLLLVLGDGDDAEALSRLIEDAVLREDFPDAVALLRRLGAITRSPADKLSIALREAAIVAENMDDIDGAIERYEGICKTLDPKNRIALHALADLEEKRNNPQGSAAALEREVPLTEGAEQVELAQRLAQLYEGPLANPRGAIKALDIVHASDPEDFDAIGRLQKLCEEIEDWPRVAGLMQTLLEVEGDEEEASRLSRRMAEILHDKLGKGDDGLAVLERLADQGDVPCQDAYVVLGDTLGWKGVVATKLVAWNESVPGPQRNEALRGAFNRFLEIGREQDAVRVGMEVARSRGADLALCSQIEEIAVKLPDLEALATAHDLLAREYSGGARAAELVRQAEIQIKAGIDPLEAIQHGESGLTSVSPGEVEPLLGRLAVLAHSSGQVIDLYERQVSRCRVPADRLVALARAAQVAAERGVNDRARSFFELALGGGVQEETIAALENAARLGDERAESNALRGILAEALAAGGQGSRDGGRTRGALLRRAATIAHRDLHDIGKAFGWLGDALITHVDDASLEALEQLGREVSDLSRVEATLSRALEEVFDGPLVRKLLHRRARLRRDVLGDRKGAAIDLKKLHDLSPADQDVMNDLSSLLLDLGDHRGMIQLYEDQILRGRDPALRAELARKVARIWEEDLADAREAADAWRRVLRMKAGDAEATAGLDRAKSGKLKRPAPPPAAGADRLSAVPAPPPARSSMPPAQPPLVQPEPSAKADASAPYPPPGFSAPESAGEQLAPVSIDPPTARVNFDSSADGPGQGAPAPGDAEAALRPDGGYGDPQLYPGHDPAAYAPHPGYGQPPGHAEQQGYGHPDNAPQGGYGQPGYGPSGYDPQAYAQPGYAEHAHPQAGYGAPHGYPAPAGYGEAYPPTSYEQPARYPPGAGEPIAEVDDVELIEEETGKHDES